MEESKQLKNGNKMGTAPMLPLIISMSLPAMFSMLVQALYNIVDSYFVAKISENALTAVSLVFPVQNLLIALGVGTAVGINSLVARRLGEGKREEADSAATHGMILGLINWIVFVIIGLFASKPFLQAFTHSPEVVQMGTQYMQIVCILSFGVFVEINTEKTLQATGNMIYPMVFQLIGALTNLILNPIFIFGLNMGIAGSAIATITGQILAMVVSTTVILRKKHEITISFKGFKLNPGIVKNIYIVGFPAIIMQSISSLMMVGMNAILMAFTETAVAVFGVYFKLQSFIFMPVFGLMQGIMPIMGFNFGARNRARLMSALKIGAIGAVCIMAVGTILFWTMTERLLTIFSASPTMIEIGVPALKTISLCFVPAALGIMLSTLFQAVGNGVGSLIVSVMRQLVVILPVAYFLSQFGLSHVWYAFPIAEGVSLLTSLVIFWFLNQRVFKKLETVAV